MDVMEQASVSLPGGGFASRSFERFAWLFFFFFLFLHDYTLNNVDREVKRC